MNYGLGTVALGDITYGTLNTGIVPHGRLIRTSAWDDSGAEVDLISGNWVNVITLASMDVTLGDLILMFAQYESLSPTTCGMQARVQKGAGTATISFVDSKADCMQRHNYNPGNLNWQVTLSSMIRVLISGTLVLHLDGHVTQPNATVPANAAQLGAWVLYGT